MPVLTACSTSVRSSVLVRIGRLTRPSGAPDAFCSSAGAEARICEPRRSEFDGGKAAAGLYSGWRSAPRGRRDISPGPYRSLGSCPWEDPWVLSHGAHLLCRFPGSTSPPVAWIVTSQPHRRRSALASCDDGDPSRHMAVSFAAPHAGPNDGTQSPQEASSPGGARPARRARRRVAHRGVAGAWPRRPPREIARRARRDRLRLLADALGSRRQAADVCAARKGRAALPAGHPRQDDHRLSRTGARRRARRHGLRHVRARARKPQCSTRR